MYCGVKHLHSIFSGYFLRRLFINLDKLSFSEVAVVLHAFENYYTPKEEFDANYWNSMMTEGKVAEVGW